ncbi:MAG: hypothetical protein ACRC8Y_09480 [Chroococcales cyanobacterium]
MAAPNPSPKGGEGSRTLCQIPERRAIAVLYQLWNALTPNPSPKGGEGRVQKS